MIETIEQQAAIMDSVFEEWLEACENMKKFPDLPSARQKARDLYQKFLLEREKYLELIKALRKMIKQLKMIQSESL